MSVFSNYAVDKDGNVRFIVVNHEDDGFQHWKIFNANEYTIDREILVPSTTGINGFTNITGKGEVFFTQNMFNDDDKWEYVVSEVNTNEELEYNVYNEDGKYIGTIDLSTIGNVHSIISNGSAWCFWVGRWQGMY